MQVAVIEFLPDEKTALFAYLKEQQDYYAKSIATLQVEQSILKRCEDKTPTEAPANWKTRLREQVKIREDKLAKLTSFIGLADVYIKAATDGTELKPKESSHIFKQLLERETSKKSVEQKYKYYPRLKKAKERTLYVFANKIKTIMESENVRFA